MTAVAAIRGLMLAALLCFAAIALAAAYWALAGQGSILLRDDNPRLIEALARIRRGSIYDRQGELLVESVQNNGGLRRAYLRPSTYSLTGYYSLRYGSGGVEAAFDQDLSGSGASDTLANYFRRENLKAPREGADLRLTVLAAVQDALASAMQAYQGAVIVMDSASGAIAAIVSTPGYDPNKLDENWESLVADAGKPFFNRAVQGLYQPGSVMTILWLAHAIETGYDLSTRFTEADAPVELEPGLRSECLLQPASEDITLIEAFIFGCPAPFVSYQATLNIDSYARLIERFILDERITLAGFPVAGGGLGAPSELNKAAQKRDILGQGNLTISPLQMAAIIAAIAGDGTAPMPTVLSGIRQPGAVKWVQKPGPSARVMLQRDTAARLRDLFQTTWNHLPALPDLPSEIDASDLDVSDNEVGAHIAIARSGESTQLWLNGYVRKRDKSAFAYVAVLENRDDLHAIIRLGRDLAAALLAL